MTSTRYGVPPCSQPNPVPVFRARTRTPQHVPTLNGNGYFKQPPGNAKLEAYRPGYPRLAAFLNSDRSFCVFKQFGRLHARVLLEKQDELLQMQEELDAQDVSEKTAYFLHTRRQNRNTDRQALLSKIGVKLIEYNALQESYYRHMERKRPRHSQLSSVRNWLDGNKPLVPMELSAYQDTEDLSSPHSPSDHAGLESFLEMCAVKLKKHGMHWIFSTKQDLEKTDDNHIVHFSVERVALASRFLTALFAVSTLTFPIVVLYNIERLGYRLWAITIFTATFSAALCLTQTRNFEIFSATAAYCAVMVVFVANINT